MIKNCYNLFRVSLIVIFIFILSGCSSAEHHPSLQQKIMPVKEGQLAYYQFGKGSPIVLITGYGATLSEWNSTFLTTLAQHHEVIVFDNRGVGNSHFSTANYSIHNLANDTAQLINNLHLHKPTVLGWSMGGMIAQTLAVEHPKLVGKLILMSTKISGKNAIQTSPSTTNALTNTAGTKEQKFNRIMKILFPADVAPTVAKNFVSNMFKPEGKPEVSVPVEVLQKQKSLINHWEQSNTMSKQLRLLHVPTLILTGTEDAIVPAQNAKLLAQIIPNARLVEIKHGGHAMMYQYPVEIGNIIVNFVEA